MTEAEFLKYFVEKEEKADCYNVNIHGVTIYTLLRQEFRQQMAIQSGVESMQLRGEFNKSALWPILLSSIQSLWQMLKLWVSNRKYPIVFLPFPRIDKIDHVYVDKFTDPLIDVANISMPYIILETGRMGVHLKPRVHSNNIINADIIRVLSTLLSIMGAIWFKKKYKKEFRALMDSLHVLSEKPVNEKAIIKQFVSQYIELRFYKAVFQRLRTKYLLGPTRPAEPFIGGHLAGVMVCELQHGITYGETIMYSGFRDPMLVPDYFLAFGENKPFDVYGIEEQKMVNIGWALQDYIESLHPDKLKSSKSVLVISDPEITAVIFQVVMQLANDNPDILFEIRPHPHEIIMEECMAKIANVQNVKIQDNKINITETLMSFDMVIGENSTVLYEALANHKKVGRLFYKGLNPKYLEDSDRNCFWEIHNQYDFEQFLKEDVSKKASKCIYSPFNKEFFCKKIGLL